MRLAGLVPVASSSPARLPERLDTLDGLVAGWLMRFGPVVGHVFIADRHHTTDVRVGHRCWRDDRRLAARGSEALSL